MNNICRLELRPVAGMFSNVNQVIQHLYMAEKQGYQFVIDWSESCYRWDYLDQDPWEYYFEPCFDLPDIDKASLPACPQDLPNVYYKGKYYDKENIIVSFLWPEGSVGLQFWPRDRNLPNRLIRQYIHMQPHIQKMVDEFAQQHFSGSVIGVHIRGEGAKDTGEIWLRTQFRSVDPRPYAAYLRAIDARLASDDQARLFVCSDSLQVISDLKQTYGERMITYEATRSQFGEMHIPNHPMNAGLTFSPYKLGEDVLVEACLLSKTQYFIHGNSNVVNFVLSYNPELEHEYAYRQVVTMPPEIWV